MKGIPHESELQVQFRREIRRQHRVGAFKRRARKIGIILGVFLMIAVPSSLFLGNKLLHPARTLAVAFSPNGRLLASASTDHTVKVWNVQSGALVRTLPIRAGNLRDDAVPFAFSPDGRILACFTILAESADALDERVGIQLWEIPGGKLLRTIKTTNIAGDYISLAFSPDGHTLAFGINAVDPSAGPLWSGSVDLWDAQSGQFLRSIDQWNVANELAFSPDGRTLVVASQDEAIGYVPLEILDVASGKRLRELIMHGFVSSIALSPDGHTLATEMGAETETVQVGDTSVMVWDVSSGKHLRTLLSVASGSGPFPLKTSVAFSPDGRTLAAGLPDKTIKMWNVATGTLLRTLTGHTSGVDAVAFSPDGRTLASGSGDLTFELWADQTIKLWEVNSGSQIRTLSS